MSLRAIDFTLALEDEAALTAFAATMGDHKTLSYIPGACVMGFLANRLYSGLTDEEARRLFHGDRARFGDARILDQGVQPTRPTPKSWYYSKSIGKPFSGSDGTLDRDKLHDRILDTPNPALRYKEIPAGELNPVASRLIDPQRRFRQKTAIDPDKNRAEESQLFGYEGLEVGQRFGGQILFSPDISDDLFGQILGLLTNTDFFVGRSRSAQYGRVMCHAVQGKAPATITPTNGQLSLWLLSDLAAWDDKGQPCLWPRPEWLGLPQGCLVKDKTFITTRRYSPWNKYANSRDRERLVIERGSVLTFHFEKPWDSTHEENVALGLGGYLAYGLGEATAYPSRWDWSRDTTAVVEASLAASESQSTQATMPPAKGYSGELIGWLVEVAASDEDRLEQKLQELATLYESFRRLHGFTPEDREGPRKTHWAAVEHIAKAGGNVSQRLADLPPVWRESTFGDEEGDNFGYWVMQRAEEPSFLARVASEARRRNLMGERS